MIEAVGQGRDKSKRQRQEDTLKNQINEKATHSNDEGLNRTNENGEKFRQTK